MKTIYDEWVQWLKDTVADRKVKWADGLYEGFAKERNPYRYAHDPYYADHVKDMIESDPKYVPLPPIKIEPPRKRTLSELRLSTRHWKDKCRREERIEEEKQFLEWVKTLDEEKRAGIEAVSPALGRLIAKKREELTKEE